MPSVYVHLFVLIMKSLVICCF